MGACVLHIAPEAAVGGPLALVHDGDEIGVDVAKGRLDLLVAAEEVARRRAAWRPVAVGRGVWERVWLAVYPPCFAGE